MWCRTRRLPRANAATAVGALLPEVPAVAATVTTTSQKHRCWSWRDLRLVERQRRETAELSVPVAATLVGATDTLAARSLEGLLVVVVVLPAHPLGAESVRQRVSETFPLRKVLLSTVPENGNASGEDEEAGGDACGVLLSCLMLHGDVRIGLSAFLSTTDVPALAYRML